MKATSGEWFTRKNRGTGVDFVVQDKDDHMIADFSTGRDDMPYAEACANARLCASAPTLLRALQVIRRTEAIYDWLAANDPKALEQVMAALAKADEDEEVTP